MGILLTTHMGFLFTITLGILFTVVLGIQFTISTSKTILTLYRPPRCTNVEMSLLEGIYNFLTEKNFCFLDFVDDSLLRVASPAHLHILFLFRSLA